MAISIGASAFCALGVGLFGTYSSVTQEKQDEAAVVFAAAKDAVVTVETDADIGSGFAIGDGTLIATCYHVIDGASYVRIKIDGVAVHSVHSFDAERDIAILKVSPALPVRIKLSTIEALQPGTKVFVIGTPLGFLTQSVSEGIVSGTRTTEGRALLQVTAPVSPGSSGSPVLTKNGEAVGMIVSTISEGQSLNFAIFAHAIKDVLARNNGYAIGARLPVSRLQDLVSQLWWDSTLSAEIELLSAGDQAADVLLARLGLITREGQDSRRLLLGQAGPLARLLGQLAEKRAVPLLVTALERIEIAPVKNMGTPWVFDPIQEISMALGRLGDSSAVPALLNVSKRQIQIDYEGPDERSTKWNSDMVIARLEGICFAAISRLDPYNADLRAHIEKRLRELKSRRPFIGAAAALAGIRDGRVVTALIEVLADPQSLGRPDAAIGLGFCGDLRAVGPLITALTDEAESVRNHAARALGILGDERAVVPLIRTLSDAEPFVRSSAAEALGLLGDKRATVPLTNALRDRNPIGAGMSAVRALTRLRDKVALPALKDFLREGDPSLRKFVEDAIRLIERR
ncbi:MAG: HEAT repeat domain-containing protein [Armatimonadetes bacterium]|nr:HEAT repeat domain-containing protein [Armatimonadota bacterium]